ncbi:MAG: histidine kinase [Gemmatimonadetes bacterium]|nr:histidine kinase [Gemmatimonadota bacterium]
MATPLPLRFEETPIAGARLRTRLLVWSAPALLGVLYAQRMGAHPDNDVPAWKLAVIALATWYVWVAFTPFVERLADRWPLRAAPVRHAVFHLAAAAFCTLLQALATALSTAVVGAASWALLPGIVGDWFWVLLPAGVVVYAAVHVARQAAVARARLEQRERHTERLALALRESQLTALRAQLQPHFLFNSLTAITALVRDGDTTRAASALEQLSALLRDALRATDVHEVPLRDEVERLTHYLRIEELRLGRALALTVQCDAEAEAALVPAWILQPLVENAVRHGLRHRAAAGTIVLTARVYDATLTLTLTDDGAGLAPDWERRAALGHGLANSRARLDVLHGAAASLVLAPARSTGACVTLVIPVRHVEG